MKKLLWDLPRNVVYYKHSEALDCFCPDKPNQYDTAEGILLGFGYRIIFKEEHPFQITEAIIENPQTGEIKHIDYQLLKNSIK